MKTHNTVIRGLLCAAALAMYAGGASAGLTATDSTFGIFDSSSGTRSFTLPSESIGNVTISIDFAKCDDPAMQADGSGCGTSNSFNSEIVFQLTHNATTVNLVNAGTYSGQTPGGRVVVDFTDFAGSVVGGALLQSGAFRPVGSLSDFNGQDAAGLWTLTIRDTTGSDPLSYFSSTLNINGGGSLPEPATLALISMGLAGLAFGKRRTLS